PSTSPSTREISRRYPSGRTRWGTTSESLRGDWLAATCSRRGHSLRQPILMSHVSRAKALSTVRASWALGCCHEKECDASGAVDCDFVGLRVLEGRYDAQPASLGTTHTMHGNVLPRTILLHALRTVWWGLHLDASRTAVVGQRSARGVRCAIEPCSG